MPEFPKTIEEIHCIENITERLFLYYRFTFTVLEPDRLYLNFQILLTEGNIQHGIPYPQNKEKH